ncbi:DinB family protein [Hymenobacter tibetensis]|uniref:DinB family protein n=1 Tax=Hymenobacter tibetensis TaxID=497967 RepID=A0ABY4CT54_9BACT|nr:DinB family protein [Hymenobacter tibetensis]UOG73222.1 DinB family protein [Hymenobacter tibetensis]
MDSTTRENIVAELRLLLVKGNAHISFEEACADIPLPLLTKTVPNLPYSIWQLVEHIRIDQRDVLEFCRNPAYVSPKWPDAYWPAPVAAVDAARWEATLKQIRNDRDQFIALLEDSAQDLFALFPHGTGQTLFREALLIADHNSYHTGQILLVRRLLQDWK